MKAQLGSLAVFFLFLPLTVGAIEKKEVLSFLTEVSAQRERSSETLKGPISPQDFQNVCVPVGARIKKWSSEKGIEIRQITKRYRNINNKATETEEAILERFVKDPKLADWSEEKDKESHLYVPIRVTQGCLNCHGDKENRPDFIKSKYPQDLAWGFKAGDLRGMFAAKIPKALSGR